MKVRAIQTGYDGVKVRQPGDEFEWPSDKPLGRWMERVNKSGRKPKSDAIKDDGETTKEG